MLLKTVIRACLMVTALSLAACDSVEERVEKHYSRGMQLLDRGETKRATLEFRSALKLNEDHAPSRFEIARLFEAEGQFRAAAGNYRRAIELDARNIEARIRLSLLLATGGAPEEARSLAEAAIALDDRNPEAHAALATAAWRLQDRSMALVAARRVLALAPNHVAGNLLIAGDRLEVGDTASVLAQMNALLESKPDERAFQLMKLRALSAAGDREGLEAHLEQMIARQPAEVDFRRMLAQLYIQSDRLPDALAQLRAIAAARPDDAEPALAVVRFRAQAEGAAAARQELETLLAGRTTPAARFPYVAALADLDVATGDPSSARRRLEAAIAEDANGSTGHDARLRLARMLLRDSDRAGAKALVDAVLDRDASDVDALTLKGLLLIDESRPDEAVTTLRRALDLDSENVSVLMALGTAHERAGSRDLAGDRFASAMRLSDYAPQATLRYALHLRERRQLEGAEAVLVESSRRNPQDRQVLATLAELRLVRGDWRGAEEAARRLEALGAEDVARRIAAASLSAQGRNEESIVALRELASRDGGSGAMIALVRAYFRTGEIDRARSLLDETLARELGNVAAGLLRAELELATGDVAGAERRLTAMVDAAPTEQAPWVALARLQRLTGRHEESVRTYQAGIAATTGDASTLRLELAQIYEGQSNFDGAITLYEELHRQSPGVTVIANNLASLLAEHRESDPAAIEFAARVAQRLRGSEVPHFQDTYGWIQFLRGDVQAALRSLVPAVEALPNLPLVRYHAGRAFAAVGRTTEARGHLEAALALDPSFPKAESAREVLRGLP